MRSNIYSMEKLQPAIRDSVHEGISMTAAYMGETVVSKELLVKLPTDSQGFVDTKRIRLRNFDLLTELHVLVAPLKRTREELGIGHYNRGVVIIDQSIGHGEITRSVAAHETAHAFGFVSDNAQHQDPLNNHHCRYDNCIMYYVIDIGESSDRFHEIQGFMGSLVKQMVLPDQKSLRLSRGQYDFCQDCKHELRDEGQKHLNQLRVDRLVRKQIL